MKARKNPIVRNPEETVASFNLPHAMKKSLQDRAVALQRRGGFAQLVRWAIEVQERRNWKDVPLAQLPEDR